MGRRSRSPDGVTRSTTMSIAVTPDEASEIREAAAAQGLSITEWGRGYLLRGARWEAGGGDPDELDQEGGPELAPVEDPIRRTERQIEAALRERPQPTDVAISERLGVSVHVVRKHRAHLGIPGVEHHGESGWRDDLLEALGGTIPPRLPRAEAERVAVDLGWTVGSVRTRASVLRGELAEQLPPEPS